MKDRLLRYFPQEIQNKTERIEGHVQDIACLQAHVLPEDGFQMEVGGKMYTEKEAAGQALIECCKKWKGDVIQDAVTYRGMSASLAFDAGSRTYWLNMHGNMTYSVELGNDPRGNITRIDNRSGTSTRQFGKSKDGTPRSETAGEGSEGRTGKTVCAGS